MAISQIDITVALFRTTQDELLICLGPIIAQLLILLMSESALSPLRRIKLFFPPLDSPLLTTYGRSIFPKVAPLKERFSAFSQRREKRVLENP